MQNNLLVLALVAACHDAAPDLDPVVMNVTEPAVEHVPNGVPHGAGITAVAVTEQGDAAVSVDSIGGLRLWPSLDGKHEPVPVHAASVVEVAITHRKDELLVGLLDQAGMVMLVRFSPNGAERSRISLPGDVEIDQLVAAEGTILVRREDQVIERYDAGGKLLGRIGAQPGIALESLTARTGIAAVLEVERTTKERGSRRKPEPPEVTATATHVHFITLGTGLAWGEQLALSSGTEATALAISPDHARYAVVKASMAQIFDIANPTTPVEVEESRALQPGAMIGFVDNAHLALKTSTQMAWAAVKHPPAPKSTDPWRIDTGYAGWKPTEETANDGVAGIGDHVFVSALGANLVLMSPEARTYLGWSSQVNGGTTVVSGPHVGVESGTHMVWLDRDLVQEKEVDTVDLGLGSPSKVWWLDPDHAVFQEDEAPTYDAEGNYFQHTKLELVDFRHRDIKRPLGAFGSVSRVEIQKADGDQLVIVDGTDVRRWALDLDHDRLDALPTLKTKTSLQWIRMLDPKQSGGLVAIIAGYSGEGMKLSRFSAPANSSAKELVGKPDKGYVEGGMIGIGTRGEIYVRVGAAIHVRHDKDDVAWPAETGGDSLAIDERGEQFATIHNAEITLADANGKQVWKQSLWGAQLAMFVANGRRVVVRTMGGLVVFDAANGKKLNSACGFSFGKMTKTPTSVSMNTPPVCEDSGT